MIFKGFLNDSERANLIQIARAPQLIDGEWVEGRQETGYEKLELGQGSLGDELDALTQKSLKIVGVEDEKWDRFLIRYPQGSSIPAHTDPPLQNDLSHVRLNAVLIAPPKGGLLYLDGEATLLQEGDAVLFRPDQQMHEVSEIREGERLLWSVGANL